MMKSLKDKNIHIDHLLRLPSSLRLQERKIGVLVFGLNCNRCSMIISFAGFATFAGNILQKDSKNIIDQE